MWTTAFLKTFEKLCNEPTNTPTRAPTPTATVTKTPTLTPTPTPFHYACVTANCPQGQKLAPTPIISAVTKLTAQEVADLRIKTNGLAKDGSFTTAPLFIEPTNGNWNTTPSFKISHVGTDANPANGNISFTYELHCWADDGTPGTKPCKTTGASISLAASQTITLGLANPCSKWQLDIRWKSATAVGQWDWGAIVEQSPQCGIACTTYQCAMRPGKSTSTCSTDLDCAPSPTPTSTITPSPTATVTPSATPTPTPAENALLIEKRTLAARDDGQSRIVSYMVTVKNVGKEDVKDVKVTDNINLKDVTATVIPDSIYAVNAVANTSFNGGSVNTLGSSITLTRPLNDKSFASFFYAVRYPMGAKLAAELAFGAALLNAAATALCSLRGKRRLTGAVP
jgi:hypothetical protein